MLALVEEWATCPFSSTRSRRLPLFSADERRTASFVLRVRPAVRRKAISQVPVKAAVKAISYYLPPRTESNVDLSREFPEWSPEKIGEKTGIHARHIADERVCSSDLAFESARLLFARHGVKPADIDFILLCTQSPDYFLPTTACLLQERLGISRTSGALDFNLGCSGYIYGLSLAKGLVETEQARNVLLITAETYSKFISPLDKSVRTIFGDASAATLIAASETGSIGPFVFGTDGRGAEHLIVKTGGMRQRHGSAASAAQAPDEFGNIRSDEYLHMNGQEILTFTLRVVPQAVQTLRQNAGLPPDLIDYYVFHQANKYILDLLRRKLNIEPEKFCEYLTDCGNTVSSTIPIALHELIRSGRVHESSRVMLVGFGVGLSWGATIITL